MNTSVNFEIAKLLKEKGFDVKTIGSYVDTTPFSENENDFVEYFFKQNHNEKEHRVSAPTIAEVVMWLYEKHGIWICVDKSAGFDWWKFNIRILKDVGYVFGEFGSDYNSPTEAYSAAIEYTLKNLI